MTEPKRLFDAIQLQLENKPLPDMLAGKTGGQWKKFSTAEVAEIVNQISAGLLNIGISPNDMTVEGRDKVGIISKNRPEWVMVDLAVQQIGALLTPIYPTINVNELEFVLNDAKVKVMIVNDEDAFLKVMSIKERVPSLQHIFSFEHIANCNHWKELLAASTPELISQAKAISEKIKEEDAVTIIYTSGTTGVPK